MKEEFTYKEEDGVVGTINALLVDRESLRDEVFYVEEYNIC